MTVSYKPKSLTPYTINQIAIRRRLLALPSEGGTMVDRQELVPDQIDSDARIIADMHKQLAEKDEEISRCWEEIRELQMTTWQRFKRWLKSEWETDERIRLF